MASAKQELLDAWEMTDERQASWFIALAINYDRTRGILTIHQTEYITDMVERFQQEGRFATVPLSKDPTEDMCPQDYDEQQEMRNNE